MIITKITKNRIDKYCKYFIRTNGTFQDVYIVDTIGRWNVGYTILISSLENKAERE